MKTTSFEQAKCTIQKSIKKCEHYEIGSIGVNLGIVMDDILKELREYFSDWSITKEYFGYFKITKK